VIRSPEQQFAFAKRLPISELAKVLQGQSDVVDMSIAQMVLREKTREEKIKQGAQAQPEAQQPSVVERDLMAAGVAALPADVDVGLAGGGVVAFAGPDGSFVQGRQLPLSGMGPASPDYVGPALQSTTKPGPGPTFSSAFPNAPTTPAIPATAGSLFRQSLRKLPFVGAAMEALSTSDEDLNKLKAFDQAKAVLAMNNVPKEEIDRMPTADVFTKAKALGYAGDRGKPVIEKKEVAAPATPAPTPTETAPAAPPPPPAKDTGATSGIAALPPPPSFESTAAEAEKIASKLFPKQTVVVPTAKEAVQQEKAYLTEAGFDPNLYKNQIAAIRKEAEGDKSMRQDAVNMRLLEAGLGILGGESPYAFVNIGKGASPALKGFQEDIKEIKKLERDRNKEILALQTAENQVAAGIGGSASARVQTAQKRLDDIEKQQGERKLSLMTHLASNNTQEYVARLNAETQRSATAETKMYREATLDQELRAKALAQADTFISKLPDTQRNGMTPEQLENLRSTLYAKSLALLQNQKAANEPPVAASYDAKGNRIK